MCRANEHSINPVYHARQSKLLNDLDMAVLHTKFVMQRAHEPLPDLQLTANQGLGSITFLTVERFWT